jgi:hypothetical protein
MTYIKTVYCVPSSPFPIHNSRSLYHTPQPTPCGLLYLVQRRKITTKNTNNQQRKAVQLNQSHELHLTLATAKALLAVVDCVSLSIHAFLSSGMNKPRHSFPSRPPLPQANNSIVLSDPWNYDTNLITNVAALRIPEAHYRIHKGPPEVTTTSYFNAVIIFHISLHTVSVHATKSSLKTNSRSADQETSRRSWSPKVHHSDHNSPHRSLGTGKAVPGASLSTAHENVVGLQRCRSTH